MDRDAVIVEVALNEGVLPSSHPHVPQQPQDCAGDARRCADVGAAVVHWHAVDPEGRQRLGDAALYGAALDAMRGSVLAYPSYRVDVEDTLRKTIGQALGAIAVLVGAAFALAQFLEQRETA